MREDRGYLSSCVCPCGCDLPSWSKCCMTCERFHTKLIRKCEGE